MCSADPAQHDQLFQGAPIVRLKPDLLSGPLSAGVHTRRQEVWDSIWTALLASGVDVAQLPGIRTDAHDFVRDGLHMSRYCAASCLTSRVAITCLHSQLLSDLCRIPA